MGASREKADLVLSGGKVITVDKAFTIAQAVAVKNGVIAAVGSDEEIKNWIGPETEVLKLEGKTVVPGFNDSHMHPIIYGMDLLKVNCGTPPNSSISDILEKVKGAAE
ncbi:MAG: amidohydrolase, partial [Deltaproteobacteria bacterium]